jgi:hypothetical protein
MNWFEVHGDFNLEGCDFCIPYGGFIRGDGRQWNIRNCRLLLTGIAFGGSNLSIANSILTYPVDYSGGGSLELVNNLCRANFGDYRSAPAIGLGMPGNSVRLERNTFITYSALIGCRFPTDGAKPTIITAESNLFCFQENGSPVVDEKSRQFPKQLRWNGRKNLYSTSLAGQNSPSPFKLADWNRTLGSDEPGSIQADSGELRFVWNDIVGTNQQASIDKLSANVAQLKQQLGNTFKDLGPTWEYIGPGDAYVKALWRDGQSTSPIELRAPALGSGPIVLIRERKQVRGYATLAEAAASAQRGDEIEIRTNEPIGSCYFEAEKGPITLRAAAGYAPVIDDEIQFANELSVAGLHFRARFGFKPGGQVSRCANCRFESGVYLPLVQDGTTEFLNCFVPGDIATTIVPGSKLLVGNSIFQSIDNAPSNDEGNGQLQIEHSVLWGPAPSLSTLRTHPTKCKFTIVARDNLFESGSHAGILDRYVRELRVAGLANWQGARNIYRHAPQHLLDELKKNRFSDEGSVELNPLFFNPSSWQWRLNGVDAPEARKFGASIRLDALNSEPMGTQPN